MSNKVPKREIILKGSDDVPEYPPLKERKRELKAEIKHLAREMAQVMVNIGVYERERCDTSELRSQLEELRSLIEGKELGLHDTNSEIERLERIYPGLRR